MQIFAVGFLYEILFFLKDFQGFLNDLQGWELSLKENDKKLKAQSHGEKEGVCFYIYSYVTYIGGI